MATRAGPSVVAAFLMLTVLGPFGTPVAQAGEVVVVGALPTARYGTSAAWDGTSAWVFGGEDQGRYFGDIVRFDPFTATATPAGSLPSPRSYTSAVWTGARAYVFGGYDGRWHDQIVAFDPQTGAAEVKQARLPTPRGWTSAVWDPRDLPALGCAGGCAYVLGGYLEPGGSYFTDIVRYHPATDQAQLVQARLPSGRCCHAAVWAGEVAYLFGGFAFGRPDSDLIVRFDPVADAAAALPQRLPQPHQTLSAVWTGDAALLFGGRTTHDTAEVLRFVPDGGPLEVVDHLPSPRRYTSAVWTGGQAHVFGGEGCGGACAEVVRVGPAPPMCDLASPADLDADGLPDCWEMLGVDGTGDGVPDYRWEDLPPAERPDPRHRDLYVEVDFMSCAPEEPGCPQDLSARVLALLGQPYVHSHRPTQAALDDVVQAFAAAPLDNPDGQTGIRLHLVVDEAVPEVEHLRFGGAGPGTFDHVKRGDASAPCGGHFGRAADRASPACEPVLRARAKVWRYALFGHDQHGAHEGSSGRANLGGPNLLVTVGWWGPKVLALAGSRAAAEAGALMHELGHTLGLGHGGPAGLPGASMNCKPNYLSVMSYTFQMPMLERGRPLDYARAALPTLDEAHLDEAQGIGGPPGRHTWAGGPLGLPRRMPASGPVDWDGDFVAGNDPDVAADVNHLRGICPPDGHHLLSAPDDWAHLQLALPPTPAGPHAASDVTADAVAALAPLVDSDGDGLTNDLDACPGESAPAPDGCPDRALTALAAAASAPASGAWTRGDWTVTLGCAGCRTEFDLDEGPRFAYEGPFAVVGEGLHTLHYQSTGPGGLEERPGEASLGIDRTGPATALEATAPAGALGGWTAGAWHVDLRCTDPASGTPQGASGCARTFYLLDGASSPSGGHHVLDHEGLHDVAARSEDHAGNAGPQARAAYGIDRTAPQGTFTAFAGLAPRWDVWTSGSWVARVACADPLAGSPAGASGCARTEMALDGEAPSERTQVEVHEEGLHHVRHRSVDRAGNAEAERGVALGVDRTPPEGRLLHAAWDKPAVDVFAPPLLPVRLRAAVEPDLAGAGPGSGIGSVCFDVGVVAGLGSPGCVPAALRPDGTWEANPDLTPGVYEVRAVLFDRVGNVSFTEPGLVVVG